MKENNKMLKITINEGALLCYVSLKNNQGIVHKSIKFVCYLTFYP